MPAPTIGSVREWRSPGARWWLARMARPAMPPASIRRADRPRTMRRAPAPSTSSAERDAKKTLQRCPARQYMWRVRGVVAVVAVVAGCGYSAPTDRGRVGGTLHGLWDGSDGIVLN